MIELKHICYDYASKQKMSVEPPFDIKVDFLHIAKRERVVVIGPSGAGKSTLLNLIAGFVMAKSGEIWLNHQNMTHTLPGKRPVSMLFQENNLFDYLTISQNVGLGIKPSLKLTPTEQQDVVHMLSKVGLAEQIDRYPYQLSGGQKQRVALARCLVQHRPILLLDEPFSALDQALRFDMLDLVNAICDEFDLTLMMISHYLDETLKQFDRCLVVNEGQIIFNQAPNELAKYPALEKQLGLSLLFD